MRYRVRATVLVCAVAALVPRAWAGDDDRPVYAVGVGVGEAWGTSTFGLSLSRPVAGESGVVVTESELQWPLTATELGFDFSWQAPRSYARHWGGWLRGRVAVSDPVGTMEDSDWLTAEGAGIGRTRIGYTSSGVKGGNAVADVGVFLSRSPLGKLPEKGTWDFLFGYRHEALYLEAWGVEDGWQSPWLGEHRQVSLDSHTRAVDFDAHHLFPYAGALYRVRAGKRFRCEIRGVGTGFVSMETDDHVLRNKRLQSLGWGLGALVSARPEWVFEKDSKSGKGATVSVGLGLEVQYARTLVGTMEQEYYDDDPYVSGDQSKSGIPDGDYFAQVVRIGGDFFLKIFF